MPRHPDLAPSLAAMRGSLFTKLAHRVATIEGERHPLHVGDSWLEPVEGARLEDLKTSDIEGLHRYAKPHGHPQLLEALEEQHEVDRARILVTAGATGGLSAVAGATLSPGDEVLILAPFWPLIRGIVQAARARAVEVPFFLRSPGQGPPEAEAVAATLSPHLSSRTAALYVNSPNNPTGCVLPPSVLDALGAFARDHGLWLWSDEVYDAYAYTTSHQALRHSAPERCFSAYSFSKTYAMAGNRCGALIGPQAPECMAAVRKVSTHSFYSAPTGSQIAAARALRTGGAWLERTRELYRKSGEEAAAALGLPPVQGGTFLFVDVRELLGVGGLQSFLEDCIDEGLILAPGSSCGEAYGGYVRLCFTSAEPSCVRRGVEKLAQRLGR